MGLRINKVAGYALQNVAYNDETYEIIDSRVNYHALYGTKRELTNQNFLAFVEDRVSMLSGDAKNDLTIEKVMIENYLEKSTDELSIIHGLIYDNECGDPNTLVIIPPGMEEWNRRDDAIDYFEASLTQGLEPVITKLYTPLYPFDGWMNGNSGEDIGYDKYSQLQAIRTFETVIAKNIGNQGEDVTDRLLHAALPNLAKEIGFKDYDDFKENCVPKIPTSIKLLAEWSNLFTNSSIYRELRPVVYTYWS